MKSLTSAILAAGWIVAAAIIEAAGKDALTPSIAALTFTISAIVIWCLDNNRA